MILARRILIGTRAVLDPQVRVAWLLDLFTKEDEQTLARALDDVAERAEHGASDAREALVG
ncbi:MAG: hypothetical protein ABI551_10340, partial [Polyangiaceae bacterium]